MATSAFALPFRLSSSKTFEPMEKNQEFDVIIIGGSYAGLSAAMTLGRSLRAVLIIDSGKPCNRQTPHSHNFITQDGEKPEEIARKAKEQVLGYKTVTFLQDLATNATKQENDFAVETKSGNNIKAKKLIFATGVWDIMPKIEGFSETWGITSIHCPYCHGYEFRSKKTGILVNNESAFDFAKLVLNWTNDLIIFTNGTSKFDVLPIQELGLSVIEKPIEKIEHHDGKISRLIFKDQTSFQLDALYHRPDFKQHCELPEKLGCHLTESGHIEVNDFQQTSIDGIYAVGDATTPFRAVSVATASGTKAGAILNHELISESK